MRISHFAVPSSMDDLVVCTGHLDIAYAHHRTGFTQGQCFSDLLNIQVEFRKFSKTSEILVHFCNETNKIPSSVFGHLKPRISRWSAPGTIFIAQSTGFTHGPFHIPVSSSRKNDVVVHTILLSSLRSFVQRLRAVSLSHLSGCIQCQASKILEN